MSQINTIPILAQIDAELKKISSILQTGFQQMVNTLRKVGETLSSLTLIGKGTNAQIWKDLGVKGTGPKGGTTMADINAKIKDIFAGKDIFAPLTTLVQTMKPLAQTWGGPNYNNLGFGALSAATKPSKNPFDAIGFFPPGVGGGGTNNLGFGYDQAPILPDSKMTKLKKQFDGIFKGIGSSMKSAFGPIALVMEILSPLITAFLEPLELMQPLFESWGTILSQLLIPIIQALLQVLIPLTPAFISIVTALMPLINLLASLITILVPLVELFAAFVGYIASLVGVVTNAIGALDTITNSIRDGFSNLLSPVTDFFNAAAGVFWNLGTEIYNAIADAIRRIGDRLRGGFDNDTSTWY